MHQDGSPHSQHLLKTQGLNSFRFDPFGTFSVRNQDVPMMSMMSRQLLAMFRPQTVMAVRMLSTESWIPPFEPKVGEPSDQKRARLLYQSRKRGMLENDLLLSTFSAKYLDTMSESQLEEYDRMINLPSNDWDLYYWATGVKPTPKEFDTEVMRLFKEHVGNKDRTARLRQPDLY